MALALLSITGITAVAQDSLVGGLLTENQTWTKEYTYIVYNDLRIPEGITLTIKSGVTVKIDQGRGIFVLGGNMTVEGNEIENRIDTVNFMANHSSRFDGWKWKGISFTNASGIDSNSISYARIVDAEIAIEISSSQEIVVKNSRIEYSQQAGVSLYNSKNCFILECLLQNNYDGVEMVSTFENETSGIQIAGCAFKNINHNIYLLKGYGGFFMNNFVTGNLIEGGNNGIWVDNGGGTSIGINTISKNVFIANGSEAGYGLLLAQDSVQVVNNIFWKNHIAISYDRFTVGSKIYNNSIYQNDEGVVLSEGSVSNQFHNNTLSVNLNSFFKFGEMNGTTFDQNNIFAGTWQEKIFINQTPDEIGISNNFWNTQNESEIQKLIWDKNDDPALGTIHYNPILNDADTTNPISPPQSVIKQLVDNQVKVSWLMNPEKDLLNFELYYGDFENYTFSNSRDVGLDTIYFSSGFNIYDSIAVTARDGAINLTDAQVMGHESPFAFAILYPYAGADDAVCVNEIGYQTTGVTIPFDYQSLKWSSSGDGNFNATDVLSPVYFPGTADIQSGKVVLNLAVEKTNGIVLIDSLVLSVYNDPIVFAGNDTIIFNDSQLELSSATAQYQQTIRWLSNGDGVFNNDMVLNTSYTPGHEDVANGIVELVLIGGSECGFTSDTLMLFIEPFFSIEGTLWYKGQTMEDAVVLAVKDMEDAARAVDMVQVGNDGHFIFDRILEGKYCLYAVPDTALKNGSVPGYYADKLRWQNAHYFQLDANTFDVDITLPSLDYLLPEGVGSISGYFAMPVKSLFAEEIFCNSFFDKNSTLEYCARGLSNITVFLYNSTATKLLDYTVTDANGDFLFDDLPYGDYIIDAEKAGYQTTASSIVTLSPDHKDETGVVIELNEKKIGIHRTGNVAFKPLVEVYPNPSVSVLNIPLTENEDGSITIAIYNSFGQLVLQTEIKYKGNPLQSHLKLDVNELKAGIYFGRMIEQGTTSGFTFIKAN